MRSFQGTDWITTDPCFAALFFCVSSFFFMCTTGGGWWWVFVVLRSCDVQARRRQLGNNLHKQEATPKAHTSNQKPTREDTVPLELSFCRRNHKEKHTHSHAPAYILHLHTGENRKPTTSSPHHAPEEGSSRNTRISHTHPKKKNHHANASFPSSLLLHQHHHYHHPKLRHHGPLFQMCRQRPHTNQTKTPQSPPP